MREGRKAVATIRTKDGVTQFEAVGVCDGGEDSDLGDICEAELWMVLLNGTWCSTDVMGERRFKVDSA